MTNPRHKYSSKRKNDKQRQEQHKDLTGGWAEWKPRRDVGVFANYRSTYKHNGETKWS